MAASLSAVSTGDVFPALGTLRGKGERGGAGPCLIVPSLAGCWALGNEVSSLREQGHPPPSPAHAPTRASSSWHAGSVFLAARPSPIWYLSPSRNPSCCGGMPGAGGVWGIWAPLLTLQPREEAGLRKRGVEAENSPTHPHPKNACGSQEALLGPLGPHVWL